MIKILTGSREFFPDGKDSDYLVIREQDEVFKHERIDGDCYFYYKPMTKLEYFTWLVEKNNWYLNTAPLVTKEWLNYHGIDIFGEDRVFVHAMFEGLFDLVYRNTPVNHWNKYAYRLYTYTQYMANGKLELTQQQLDTAYQFKKRTMTNVTVAKNLYQFFSADEEPSFTG